ncbi:hypothetical protein NQD34_005391 [Periophthalmus magnuspinnatus]|nr:hypothetical protein NQD34_005391 [Periophthalmus magnuspinnatus]
MFDAIVEHLKKKKENPFDLETELKKLSEDSDGDDLSFIKEMINGPDKEGHYKGRPSNKSFLYEIVANKRTGIDVDKFDYFARDCHHLGIKNSFDHNRYIKFARVLKVDGQWQICTRDKEVPNIYEMFHTRSSLHRKAYQHKTNKAVELMIRDALLKADPVLKMSKAIKDIADKTMEEYTQLTDSIFEKILYSTGDELKEAREILQNILSRKLYRFLGETKLTDGFAKEEEKQISEMAPCETQDNQSPLTKEEKWKSDLAVVTYKEQKPLTKDDFEITIISFDFGQKDKNPMDNLYVYNKFDNEKAFKIPSEQVSQFLLPNKFSEKWIRVYCTSLDKTTQRVAQKSFYEWCRRKNLHFSPSLPQTPTANPQPKVFNDPIHGHMEFHPILVKIIDTPQFQRLRFIKQMGGAYFVYPGASHNRFEHSLGVAHLAGQFLKSLQKKLPQSIDDQDILCVQIASLCYDLGHGPFSNVFDRIVQNVWPKLKWERKTVSAELFKEIGKSLSLEELSYDDRLFIEEIIQEKETPKGRPKEKHFLYDVVSNKRNAGVSVKLFDSVARDCYYLGLQTNFDHQRFIKFAKVLQVEGNNQICIRDKVMSTMYDLFHTIAALETKAYKHNVTMKIELMMADVFKEQMRHKKEQPTTSATPEDAKKKVLEIFLQLTDCLFGERLAEEPTAKDIVNRIHDRDLYTYVTKVESEGAEPEQNDERRIDELAKELNTEPDNIATFESSSNFGNQDPICGMNFFDKKGTILTPEQTEEKKKEMHIPHIDRRQWTYVFLKNKNDCDLEAAKQTVKTILTQGRMDNNRPAA